MSSAAETPSLSLLETLAGAAGHLAGDPAVAASLATSILEAIPAQPHALMVLVNAYRAVGDADGARTALQAMAEKHPDLAALHYELGLLLIDAGDRVAALGAFSRVVQLEPRHPQAWGLLANLLAAGDEIGRAADAYVQQFESSVVDLRTLEAAVSLETEHAEIIAKVLREFLTLHPTDVPATHMLGKLCVRLQLFEDAERFLARTIELAPDFAPAVSDHHTVLRQQFKWEQLLQDYDRLLVDDPENTEYISGKASTLSQLGEHAPSLRLYERLIHDAPDEPRFWAACAHALRTLGRRDDAIAAYRKSIALDSGHGEGWWGLADLKTISFSREETDRMREQLARPDLRDQARICLHFALGAALEKQEDFKGAFAHFSEANALRRIQLPYDPDDTTENVRRIKKRYGRTFYDRHARSGCPSPEPIFVVGLPRSGSTLVEQILAAHSEIEGTGELPSFVPIAVRFSQIENSLLPAGGNGNSLTFERESLASAGEEYIARCRAFRKLSRPHFTDKSTSNFHHLGLICAMLPNAKIVDVRRHPMACCFSSFKQFFPAGAAQTYDLAQVGRYYRDYVDLLAHFDRVLPGRVHRIFYEDLIRDSETQIRALLDHCGVPFEEGCLRFWQSDRPVLTVSSEQVRQPMYDTANQQWRNFEEWLGPLRAALGTVLDAYPAIPDGFGS